MMEFTEAQLVEIVLVAAKRGYRQAIVDAEKRSAGKRDECAQEGIEAFRKNALAVMRKRLAELKQLKANELLVAGFNEAIEYLEFGVDKEWLELSRREAADKQK